MDKLQLIVATGKEVSKESESGSVRPSPDDGQRGGLFLTTEDEGPDCLTMWATFLSATRATLTP